jgi:hypothetical protein
MSKSAEKIVEKVREIVCEAPCGDRAIVVADRGWIFAGRVSDDGDSLTITDCVNVRSWKTGGFGGLTLSAKDAGAVLDKCAPVKLPKSAVIFVVPIGGEWNA